MKWFPLAILVAIGCGGGDPTQLGTEPTMVRQWAFQKYLLGQADPVPFGDAMIRVGSGEVNDSRSMGMVALHLRGTRDNAVVDVFSSDDGKTYWIDAVAPVAAIDTGNDIGSETDLVQWQYFEKTTADATLVATVSQAFFDIIDTDARAPDDEDCPWRGSANPEVVCRNVMSSKVHVDMWAGSLDAPGAAFAVTGGTAELRGYRGHWGFAAHTANDATLPFWSNSHFDLDPDQDDDGGAHAVARFIDDGEVFNPTPIPIVIRFPLDSVPVGGHFYFAVSAKSMAYNHRQSENYVGAFFRDPTGVDGVAFEFTGLEPIATPQAPPPAPGAAPAPACTTGIDPAAGTLQLGSPQLSAAEGDPAGATVVVTRTGGSRGAVSVVVTPADGTATAGADYAAAPQLVVFPDGDDAPRAVTISLVDDRVAETDETINLTLSGVGGCATLGSGTTAVLTVLDDDHVAAGFHVGGTITGLAGSGLALREIEGGGDVAPATGSFRFPVARPDGSAYDVRVTAQPTNPSQVCTVANASGTIAGADVTNVVVTCTTPGDAGALDPSFGSGGKAIASVNNGANAMAIQADGKLVFIAAGRLLRLDADGSPDAGFGPITVGLDGVNSLALQPDGKIVVAGELHDDFAVARYLADGTLDPGFGIVTTDFAGGLDQAFAVAVQPDGKIVVAGNAARQVPLGTDADFAVARYLADGHLDGSFGTGGKVTTDVAGTGDSGRALALLSDGRILVAGRAVLDDASAPDVGLVRYLADGSPDPGFGILGVVRKDLTGLWDEASSVALTTDGQIVIAGRLQIGSHFSFGVARFTADGTLDAGFGHGGLATTDFAADTADALALALQPDGKIVAVGDSKLVGHPADFAVARYLPDGSPDPGFAAAGKLTVDFFGSIDRAQCMALQPDGKIVAAGFALNGTAGDFGAVRILP